MSRLKLPSGRQARIGVRHDMADTKRHKQVHRTTLHVTIEGKHNELSLQGQSLCSPKDRYCKHEGRKVALIKLLQADEGIGLLDKADRAALFHKVCPKLFKNV